MFGVAVTVVIAYFLLEGIRWLWFLAIAFEVIGLVTPFTIDWSPLHKAVYLVLGLIGLGLLVVPETRRYFGARHAA